MHSFFLKKNITKNSFHIVTFCDRTHKTIVKFRGSVPIWRDPIQLGYSSCQAVASSPGDQYVSRRFFVSPLRLTIFGERRSPCVCLQRCDANYKKHILAWGSGSENTHDGQCSAGWALTIAKHTGLPARRSCIAWHELHGSCHIGTLARLSIDLLISYLWSFRLSAFSECSTWYIFIAYIFCPVRKIGKFRTS